MVNTGDKQAVLAKANGNKANGGDKACDITSKAKKHEVSGLRDAVVVLTSKEVPADSVLHIKNCRNTKVTVRDVKLVRLLVEGCKGGCVVTREQSPLLSGTVEAWSCDKLTLHSDSYMGTLQVDMCSEVSVSFARKEHMGQVVEAGVKGLNITFGDNTDKIESGFEVLKRTLDADLQEDDDTTQFITRFIEGKATTEKLVRLVNDFPTTEREHKAFHSEAAATEEKLRELGEEMLKAGKELTPEEKVKLDALVAQKTKEDAEKPEKDVGELARAESKRKKGNEEFKGGNIPQALVHYTESILIKPDPSALCNRAACFLKMHEYDKVLADCDACIKLDALYVKAHFRKGLAMMELHRYGEAGVCFTKTLELEPTNKQAKASITMAQQKAHFETMKAQKK